MTYDLATLTRTLDLRSVPSVHARIVCAMRYVHSARAAQAYTNEGLARYLGSNTAVTSFHVFLDETGQAWPEPVALNPACQPAFSYDEMLLVDLATAAARGERARFDDFLRDMVGESGRNAIWSAARRMMRHLVATVA